MTTPKAVEEAFNKKLADAHSYGLWQLHGNIGASVADRPRVQPRIWRWETMRDLALESARLESLKGSGERLALQLANPGLPGGFPAISKTLTAAIQIVRPGEIASAHHHTAAAIRFIISGRGAYTVQDGERFIMDAGDLTLTPNWAYHDHGNETDEPMIWLDGLDAPLVMYLDSMFQEEFPEDVQPVTKPNGYTNNRIGQGLMRGVKDTFPERTLPITYKWADCYEALVNSEDATPFDGVAMEYNNPVTGGHTMPTIACVLQQLRPGVRTQAHRHTSTVVYHVAKGSGYSIINGLRVDWHKGDTFVQPSWAMHEHGNESRSDDAVLFAMSDLPVIEALGLYREQEGDHQEVTGKIEE